MWRRQFGGKVDGAIGSVDALGMTVSDAGAAKGDQTHFYSLDPSTGRVRWSKTIACGGDPTPVRGTQGQFFFQCDGNPSVIDARTGHATDMPSTPYGEHPEAGTDVYVYKPGHRTAKGPDAKDVTRVIDPAGKLVDQISGAYPVSRANDGFLLLCAGGDTWLLRDYRRHRSTPVPIHLDTRLGLDDVETAWLENGLAITTEGRSKPLLLIDPARPAADPSSAEELCAPGEIPCGACGRVAGAVIVQCGPTQVVGLVPPDH